MRSRYFERDRGLERVAPEVRGALNDLHWCDSLVLVYPTWWMNMPAMLKGFFDRTFVPGIEGAWDFPPADGALGDNRF